ncbi:RluA family pseudouridine synthase [Oceanivirga miroungae]|uniref:Pseudouridine synthase n=1 Tax=Oceanivirga miroungae TaxID=1130046 RepID=A0A6I8MFB0_9FUSO|nr:RluA family pseudouridine synthase [Oceanivirga miroungae]VWL85776.1 pseudouridine synthase [Oceanivirga miroungae]
MKIKVIDGMENIRVDKFLSSSLNLSRNIISKSKILVNGEETKLSYKLKLDDIVEIEVIEKKELKIVENNIKIKTIYEDEYLAVVDKPYGIVVHPSETSNDDSLVGSLVNKFEKLSDIDKLRPGIVHRLDKDTSGLIIIAKDNDTHLKLQEMFKSHNLEKVYLAILKGNFKYDKITVKSYIGRDKKNRKKMSSNTDKGRLAISHFEKIKSNDKISLVKVSIETGRTHQIRVHAKELNYPVLYDSLYTKDNNSKKRQQLHSYYLKFTHPITNNVIELKCEMPDDMIKTLKNFDLGDFDVRI